MDSVEHYKVSRSCLLPRGARFARVFNEIPGGSSSVEPSLYGSDEVVKYPSALHSIRVLFACVVAGKLHDE